ncbi:biotin transporter BioY [Acholeplasma vituli]|uniref:Biotin transporter n=1 Tax=Paracholeplasma vituli TaxID=69473 RepID=A0ABT2PY86_9MOLU|nr:biotin transporter BioY [Paracholeplasma vituli]MCU0104702.1 biotin transporter BioY [Paracholeplasma vituli]
MSSLNRLIKIAAMTAVLCISVYLIPPILLFGGVPFTIQTMVIFLIAYLFNKTDALLIVLLYLVIGLFGLPVFSNGQSGLSAILGPSGGFLVGFPLITYAIASLKSKDKNVVQDWIVTILFGVIILYGGAALWLAYVLEMNYVQALLLLLPFVPFDLIKMVIAHTVYRKMPSLYELSTH